LVIHYLCGEFKNHNTMKTPAKYVSIWDDNLEVSTNCLFDSETNNVTEIEQVDMPDLEICHMEYVLLENNEKVFNYTIESETEQHGFYEGW
jgi:hypothetical protein